MEFPILDTDRLYLIEITDNYLEDIYNIFSLEEVTKYYGMNALNDIDQAKRMIESFSHNFKEKRSIRWGIISKETDQFIGTIGLNNLQLWNKRTEIGYDIHPSYWKKGFASEAVKEVLRYCFNDLDLYRVGAITFPENPASYNLLLKLGFQKEGLLRGYIYQRDQSNDAFIFSLLKKEWENRQNTL